MRLSASTKGWTSRIFLGILLVWSMPTAQAIRFVPRDVKPYEAMYGHANPQPNVADYVQCCSRRPGGHVPKFEDFVLHFDTVNGSSWGSCLAYLKVSAANVVMIQEHKLLPHQLDAANAQAMALGWTAIWASATRTKKGGASGGLAILARRGVGIRRDEFDTTQPSRLLCGVVEAPGLPAISCSTVYFQTGTGMKGKNLGLIKEIGHYVRATGRPGVVAGDFNDEPQALRQTNLLREIEGEIFVPERGVPTCTAGRTHSAIDYGIFYGGLAECVQAVRAVRGTEVKTHRPVSFVCHPKLQQLRMRTAKNPPRLPRTAVIGPRWKSDSLGTVTELAQTAMQLAVAGHHEAAVWHRDMAYEAFADCAEQELVANTGYDLKVGGLRARELKTVWAPLLERPPRSPIDIPEVIQEQVRTVHLLRDAAHELSDLAARPVEQPLVCESASRQRTVELIQEIHGSIDDDSIAKAATTSHEERTSDDDRLLALVGSRSKIMKNGLELLCLLLRHEDGSPADYQKVHDKMKESLEEVMELADKMDKDKGKAIHVAWAGLVKGSGRTATKRAFLATQLPAQWRSEAVPTDDVVAGGVSADPLRILQAERDKLDKLWHGKEEPHTAAPVAPWGGYTALPKLSPHKIRQASRSFKIATAETYDGFHVRHFDLLSEECLASLCDILEVCECLLQMPTCNATVTVGLVPKPKGGHRPIGIFPALERLWAKARSDLMDQWQWDNRRDYFACAKGSGASDVVWNQAVKAEANVANSGSSASVLMDLKSFFDTIDLDLLLERCVDTHFPMVFAQMATAAYKAPRSVSVRRTVAAPVNATRGILAGHVFALALVQVYYLPVMDAFWARHLDVDIDVYVDDLTLTARKGRRRRT